MAETYDLYFGTISGSLDLVVADITATVYAPPSLPLAYNTVYYWRVDATNEYGTTVGDEWHFTTLVFTPPTSGPTSKILVACANNKVWYEDI